MLFLWNVRQRKSWRCSWPQRSSSTQRLRRRLKKKRVSWRSSGHNWRRPRGLLGRRWRNWRAKWQSYRKWMSRRWIEDTNTNMHTVTVSSWEDRCEVWTCELQVEEESKLRAQVSGLGQELSSEKSRTAELQKALEQSQGSLTKLQSDFYGKESEVSALRQDMKVMWWSKNVYCLLCCFFRALLPSPL